MAREAKLNTRLLKSAIAKSSEMQRLAKEKAQDVFDSNKRELLKDIVSDEVSKEISAGEFASNTTNTLNGYGNLFSFIGFPQGSDPIGDLVNLYNTETRIDKRPLRPNKDLPRYDFKIFLPSEEDLIRACPMPWESGRSWVTGIALGISGFGYYIYIRSKSSRSGSAVQIKNKLRNLTFTRRPYMTPIINKFLQKTKARIR